MIGLVFVFAHPLNLFGGYVRIPLRQADHPVMLVRTLLDLHLQGPEPSELVENG